MWRPLLRKFGWQMLGLLAPEMNAFPAWYQRKAAHSLDKVMRCELGQRSEQTMAQEFVAFLKRHCRKGEQAADSGLEIKDLESHGSSVRPLAESTSVPHCTTFMPS